MTRGSREIRLRVPETTAWDALVSPERHRWYYRLTPEGEFKEGGTIHWKDGNGSPAEESEVIEVKAPNRLAMRSRFLYAPVFAAQPPHTLTWEVAKAPKGCRVRMAWDAGEIVSGLLESEADNILHGLRLEHDPGSEPLRGSFDSPRAVGRR